MRSTRWLLLFILLTASPAAAQEVTTDPDAARLVVEDLRRLARVLDSVAAGGDTLEALEREYLGNASSGLRAYAERYGVTSATLAAALREHPAAYADLDGLVDFEGFLEASSYAERVEARPRDP